MTPEVILTNNYDQKCDIFSFEIMMFQILTKKIDNIYEQNKENDEKSEMKDVKKSEVENNELNFSNITSNIELWVANDLNFRPKLEKKLEKKKYFEFIDLMKKCWNHNPKERPVLMKLQWLKFYSILFFWIN
jgi:CO dehydrogenase/acetyl-CoA synthase alpha subunit